MNLSEIRFPVFKLNDYRTPVSLNGVIFYTTEYREIGTDTYSRSLKIIDDINVAGSTLGLRRLRLSATEGVDLYPIRTAVYFLSDLIKQVKAGSWFIDNSGKLFKYKKLTRAKLTCHKLKRLLPLNKGMGCIIEVEDIAQRFKCLYRPSAEYEYVGILKWGLSYLLYGFYEEKFKPTHRLV